MEHPKLVVVHSYGTPAEAALAKSVLEDAGIDSMIQGDTAGRMRDHLAWSGLGFQVFVREEDLTAARDVLDHPAGDLDDQPEDPAPDPGWRFWRRSS